VQKIDRMLCYLAALSISVSVQVHVPTFAYDRLESGRQFDCVNAFDLVAVATTIQCAVYAKPISEAGFSGAIERLIDAGFFTRADFAEIAIEWCPLTRATGFTPDATRIFIDAGLKDGGVDLIAEVLAHEMIHVQQFREIGARGFKCDYINAFLSCGGCQDRAHELEAEAYGFQDTAREHFLRQWLSPITEPVVDAPVGHP
jgi:hypothetical protein